MINFFIGVMVGGIIVFLLDTLFYYRFIKK